jgi:hypothetical protein
VLKGDFIVDYPRKRPDYDFYTNENKPCINQKELRIVGLNYEIALETSNEIGSDKSMAIKCDVSKKGEVKNALTVFASKNN